MPQAKGLPWGATRRRLITANRSSLCKNAAAHPAAFSSRNFLFSVLGPQERARFENSDRSNPCQLRISMRALRPTNRRRGPPSMKARTITVKLSTGPPSMKLPPIQIRNILSKPRYPWALQNILNVSSLIQNSLSPKNLGFGSSSNLTLNKEFSIRPVQLFLQGISLLISLSRPLLNQTLYVLF